MLYKYKGFITPKINDSVSDITDFSIQNSLLFNDSVLYQRIFRLNQWFYWYLNISTNPIILWFNEETNLITCHPGHNRFIGYSFKQKKIPYILISNVKLNNKIKNIKIDSYLGNYKSSIIEKYDIFDNYYDTDLYNWTIGSHMSSIKNWPSINNTNFIERTEIINFVKTKLKNITYILETCEKQVAFLNICLTDKYFYFKQKETENISDTIKRLFDHAKNI